LRMKTATCPDRGRHAVGTHHMLLQVRPGRRRRALRYIA